jgi:hypothetical protein
MRLGPTFHRHTGPEQQPQHQCSKCKVEFPILQMVKINDKQLCIWCAGHPEGMHIKNSFTLRGKKV